MIGHRRLLIVGLAVVVAATLVLLANAVFAVDQDIHAQDVHLAYGTPDARTADSAGSLGVGVVESILGVDDDRAFREAAAHFLVSRLAVDATPEETLEQHAESEARLTRLVRQGGDRTRRSHAANLNASLLFEDASINEPGAERYLELSLQALQEAVRLDPGNDEAKYNLELFLTIGSGDEERPGGSSSPTSTPGGETGAGVSPPGSGY